MFNIKAPMIRSALFFTLSIVITDMLHLGMPVFSVFLGPALILRDKFSLNKSLVFISLISIYFISGSLAATILAHNQWALIVISIFVIYSYLRIEKLASFSTAPVFFILLWTYQYNIWNFDGVVFLPTSTCSVHDATTSKSYFLDFADSF